MDKLTMQITGMTCGHCVAGVTVDQVAIGTASVAYDPTATTPADITTAVEDEGYHVVSTA